MRAEQATIGRWVKTNQTWPNVPEGTEGVIVEDYGSGVTVAWDLPDRPLPDDITLEEIAAMPAINPKCPLRDGFNKEDELQFLEVVS